MSPLGNLYGCFNHITGDAGVMLLLLDLIYSACQMLIWYHYYCQKRIYFYFFTCAVIAALYSFCMCVCVRAPARCSGNDGTQGHLPVPRKRVFQQLHRMLHEFSQSILYSGEPLKCIKKQFVFYSQVCFDTLIKKN